MFAGVIHFALILESLRQFEQALVGYRYENAISILVLLYRNYNGDASGLVPDSIQELT